MKKATKAAIFVTAAAALYGAAAYGVTRTLMDVAMKREAPKALKNKGSAQLTAKSATNPTVRRSAPPRKRLASSETETVLLENREGLTLVGHLRECEKAKRLVIAFHGWRSAWYRDFGLLADFFKPRAVQRALCGAARAERERGRLHRLRPDRALRLRRLGKLGSRTLPRPARLPYGRVARRGDGAHGRRRYSPRRGARRDCRLGLHLAACDLAARDGARTCIFLSAQQPSSPIFCARRD